MKLQKLTDYLQTKWYDDTEVEKVENEIFSICKEMILEELPNEMIDDQFPKNEIFINHAKNNLKNQGAKWYRKELKKL